MSSLSVSLKNPGLSAPICISRQLRDAKSGEWTNSTPVAAIGPMESAPVILTVGARIVIETPSTDELSFGIDNPSASNTIKVSAQRVAKGFKPGDIENVGFAHASHSRFGAAPSQTSIVTTLSASRRVLIELMPS